MMTISRQTGSKATITIRKHYLAEFESGYSEVWICIMETRTRAFSCLWTRETAPTETEVLVAWKTDRKSFNPGYSG